MSSDSDDVLGARLRRALTSQAGADDPVARGDLGALAGRIAGSTRRRQRVLMGAAGLALVVGTVGGYVGGSASSTTGSTHPVNASASPSAEPMERVPDISPNSPTTQSGAGATALCPDVSGPTGGDGSAVGSATHVFTRVSGDGVTIRVYRLPAVAIPACGGLAPDASATTSTTTESSNGIATPVPSSDLLSPSECDTSTLSVEMSDDTAVGQGGIGGLSFAVAQDSPGSVSSGVQEPEATMTGVFGLVEGDPVWWAAAEVGSEVAMATVTFADGSTDQMAPIGGVVVLAHHVDPGTLSADSDPSAVRGTLQLLDASGAVLATVTLPEPPPVATPVPLMPAGPGTTSPTGMPPSSAGAGSSNPVTTGPSAGGSSSSSNSASNAGGSIMIACPLTATSVPPAAVSPVAPPN